jgi:hypothetical protein
MKENCTKNAPPINLRERGKVMSVLKKIILLFATLTITAVPALAVNEGRSHPSEILIWGFLGCCALIIVAQIAPLIRNVRKQAKTAAEQTRDVTQH